MLKALARATSSRLRRATDWSRAGSSHAPLSAVEQPGSRNADPRSGPSTGRLIAIVVGIGIALRVAQFVSARSFWIDEARLANAIASRSFGDVFTPLTYDQVAPPLFIAATKLVSELLGVNEMALRVIPLIAGIVSVLLMARLVRQLLPPRSSLLAVGFISLSPTLVFYSNELKPYAVDLAVALWLVLCTLSVIDAPRSRRAWVLLASSGAVAMWLSMPSVFVLAVIGAVLGAEWLQDRRAPTSLIVGTVLLWAVLFIPAYVLAYSNSSDRAYLLAYWAPSFFTPGAPGFPLNVWESLKVSVWAFMFGHAGPLRYRGGEYYYAGPALALVLAVSIVGFAALRTRVGVMRTALLTGPVGVTVLAAVIGLYPFGTRLVLFTAPFWIIPAAYGFETAIAWIVPDLRRRAWIALSAVLLTVPTLYVLFDTVIRTPAAADPLPLLTELDEIRSPGEPVYVSSGGLPAWAFYSTDWDSPDTAEVAFHAAIGGVGGAAFENAEPRGHPVRCEGVERQSPRGLVIYGVPSGKFMRSLHGYHLRQADTGWAENEAHRIKRGAHPTVWVLLSHFHSPELELLRELEQLDGEAVDTLMGTGTVLLRYQFATGSRVVQAEPCSPSPDAPPS